jgi:hypothetical protein
MPTHTMREVEAAISELIEAYTATEPSKGGECVCVCVRVCLCVWYIVTDMML